MNTEPTKIEYRIRPVERYVITRFTSGPAGENSGSVEGRGEYDNEEVAFEVAYALAKAEHERLGWPIADERIQYPRRFERTGIPVTDGVRLSEVSAACAGVAVPHPQL